MKEKVDTSSPEYKRQLTIVLVVMILLTGIGGLLLAYRINEAESKNAAVLESSSTPLPKDSTPKK